MGGGFYNLDHCLRRGNDEHLFSTLPQPLAASLYCYGFGRTSFWSEIAVFVLVFLSLFGFLLMFLQWMISYFIFQQIYCLNILRMPFKIKRKKVKCLINARHCSAFYILLYNHLYTFTNFCYTFSNYIQFYMMIFYTYTYVSIHSISTLYWNLCSGLFLGIAKCDHL